MVVAIGTGGGLTRALGVEGALERLTLSATIGLGAVAWLVFALGVVGLIAPVPIILVLFAAGGLGLAAVFSSRNREHQLRLGHRRWWGALVVSVVAALPFVALALYPSTGFDANLYHLPSARAFAETHRLGFIANLRVPVFAQLYDAPHSRFRLVADEPGYLLFTLDLNG